MLAGSTNMNCGTVRLPGFLFLAVRRAVYTSWTTMAAMPAPNVTNVSSALLLIILCIFGFVEKISGSQKATGE